jgi:hypothetical protein
VTFHEQDDPYPGGLVFRIAISGQHAYDLWKALEHAGQVRRNLPKRHEFGHVQGAVFLSLAHVAEQGTPVKYVINRIVEMRQIQDRIELTLIGSPVVGPEDRNMKE